MKGSGSDRIIEEWENLMDFWTRLDILVSSHEVVIDRRKGAAHPRYPELVYPLDYGFLQGTSGGDGNEVDVWRGSITPAQLVAVVCTVDTLKGDAEIKLLLGCTDDEIGIVTRFHNGNDYMSGIVVKREGNERELRR
jgi:inorganic pyrophosphatase